MQDRNGRVRSLKKGLILEGYQKEANKLMPILRRKYKAYPKFLQTLENRHIRYNETLNYMKKQEKEGKLYVIRPEAALKISAVEKNPQKLQEIYERGREVAQKQLREIEQYLSK